MVSKKWIQVSAQTENCMYATRCWNVNHTPFVIPNGHLWFPDNLNPTEKLAPILFS